MAMTPLVLMIPAMLTMIGIITDTMRGRGKMTEHITASEARGDFRGTLNRVVRDRERLVITRHNDEEVAVIPIEDLRLLEALERRAEDAIDGEDARRILADPDEGRESWDDLKEELGL